MACLPRHWLATAILGVLLSEVSTFSVARVEERIVSSIGARLVAVLTRDYQNFALNAFLPKDLASLVRHLHIYLRVLKLSSFTIDTLPSIFQI